MITKEPSSLFIHPLQNGVYYELQYDTNSNVLLESVRVEIQVNINATTIPVSYRAYAYDVIDLGQGFFTYKFRTNITGAIKPFFSPNSKKVSSVMLDDIPNLSNDVFCNVQPHFFYESKNANNELYDVDNEISADAVFIVNAAINRWDLVKGLQPYYEKNNPLPENHKFLTKQPRNYILAKNQTFWLSLFQDVGDFEYVIEYWALGVSQQIVQQVQAGSTGISTFPIFASQVPDSSFRVFCRNSNSSQISEFFNFTVSKCEGTQVVWFNECSGSDSYVFLGTQNGLINSDAQIAQTNVRNLSATERGLFKVHANGSETHLIRDIVDNTYLEYLRYLPLSPEVYIFLNNQWCSCVVLDAKFPAYSDEKPFHEIEIVFQLQNPISQSC